jgi:hypothetical protein
MKRIIFLLVGIAALVASGLIYLNRPDHKYRLTIEVQTPEEVRSSSGVMAVHKGTISGPLPEVVAGVSMRGEAVYADLGGGQNLVAILAHGKNASHFDGMGVLAMNAFAAVGRKVPFREVKQLSGTVQLNGNLIPTLVMFANVADPKTARVLDPGNLEADFGGGYHLKRVTLEMLPVGFWPLDFGGPLGEPVTRGIATKLPWVTTVRGYLSGQFACNPSEEVCLEVGQFRR